MYGFTYLYRNLYIAIVVELDDGSTPKGISRGTCSGIRRICSRGPNTSRILCCYFAGRFHGTLTDILVPVDGDESRILSNSHYSRNSSGNRCYMEDEVDDGAT